MSTDLERSLGDFFNPHIKVPRRPKELTPRLVEYQVYDDDKYSSIPAYRGPYRVEAEQIAATLKAPEIVEITL